MLKIISNLMTLTRKFGITILLLLVLFSLSIRFLFDQYSSDTITSLNQKINQQTHINQQQKQENKRLAQQIDLIKNPNSPILESQARYRLGLVKPKEVYYQYK